MLSAPGLRAVVLETFGAGNAPTNEWFIRVLKEAIDRGVIILNITQCGGGKVSMELYETGLRLQKIGVLCGHDMTTEAAVTKLMYVLGLELSDEQTRALLRRPARRIYSLRRCTERFFFIFRTANVLYRVAKEGQHEEEQRHNSLANKCLGQFGVKFPEFARTCKAGRGKPWIGVKRCRKDTERIKKYFLGFFNPGRIDEISLKPEKYREIPKNTTIKTTKQI